MCIVCNVVLRLARVLEGDEQMMRCPKCGRIYIESIRKDGDE